MSIAVRQTSTLAIVSLVSGILGWTLVPMLGTVIAIITGHMARSEIRNAPERLEGDGFAVAGLVLGWVAAAGWIIGAAVLFLFLGGLAMLAVQG